MTLTDANTRKSGTHAAPGSSTSAERPTTFLHPGRIVAASTPTIVTTILGSCVAVALWEAELRVGGMCHIVLPQGASNARSPMRFANAAVPEIVSQLCALGAHEGSLRAKIVGGANVVPALEDDRFRLGQKNIAAAERILADRGIHVCARDLGGRLGRKLIFHTDDGSAQVRVTEEGRWTDRWI